ncbi:MAG: hypothetical protein Fur0025_34880 [Oscillatoriaceae cyanobacterium]
MAIKKLFVLDTNVVLYYLGGKLIKPLPTGDYAISIITEIELLSYPSLTKEEDRQIKNFFQFLTIVNIDHQIKQLAIDFRRRDRLKLPDAIIVATAKAMDATLLTNDANLGKLTEIKVESVQI